MATLPEAGAGNGPDLIHGQRERIADGEIPGGMAGIITGTVPALSFDNVGCTFISSDDPGKRYTAVGDTTLHIAPGEFVSVVGPTGCGKSTLLNLAAGLLQPSSGSVKVFGEPLVGLNRRAAPPSEAQGK